jgi:hypothetical protein
MNESPAPNNLFGSFLVIPVFPVLCRKFAAYLKIRSRPEQRAVQAAAKGLLFDRGERSLQEPEVFRADHMYSTTVPMSLNFKGRSAPAEISNQ